ncbi:MAG: ATP-binding protein [Candidatus Omnitrophota bacterium]|nr:ATP-binding protein [Candidatus Omnitrophota bacterium]
MPVEMIMDRIDELGMQAERDLGIPLFPLTTSGSPSKGFFSHDEWRATSLSVLESICAFLGNEKALKYFKIDPKSENSIIIQGFGEVGSNIIRLIKEFKDRYGGYKFKIVGLSDLAFGAYYNSEGMDVEELYKLAQEREEALQGGDSFNPSIDRLRVCFGAKAEKLNDINEIVFKKAKILALAAVPYVLRSNDDIERLQCQIVAPAANIVLGKSDSTYSEIRDLEKFALANRIASLPSWLLNFGGIAGSDEEFIHRMRAGGLDKLLGPNREWLKNHVTGGDITDVAWVNMYWALYLWEKDGYRTPLSEIMSQRASRIDAKVTEILLPMPEPETLLESIEMQDSAVVFAKMAVVLEDLGADKIAQLRKALVGKEGAVLSVRRAAAYILGRSMDPSNKEALLKIIEDDNEDGEMYRNALSGIGYLIEDLVNNKNSIIDEDLVKRLRTVYDRTVRQLDRTSQNYERKIWLEWLLEKIDGLHRRSESNGATKAAASPDKGIIRNSASGNQDLLSGEEIAVIIIALGGVKSNFSPDDLFKAYKEVFGAPNGEYFDLGLSNLPGNAAAAVGELSIVWSLARLAQRGVLTMEGRGEGLRYTISEKGRSAFTTLKAYYEDTLIMPIYDLFESAGDGIYEVTMSQLISKDFDSIRKNIEKTCRNIVSLRGMDPRVSISEEIIETVRLAGICSAIRQSGFGAEFLASEEYLNIPAEIRKVLARSYSIISEDLLNRRELHPDQEVDEFLRRSIPFDESTYMDPRDVIALHPSSFDQHYYFYFKIDPSDRDYPTGIFDYDPGKPVTLAEMVEMLEDQGIIVTVGHERFIKTEAGIRPLSVYMMRILMADLAMQQLLKRPYPAHSSNDLDLMVTYAIVEQEFSHMKYSTREERYDDVLDLLMLHHPKLAFILNSMRGWLDILDIVGMASLELQIEQLPVSDVEHRMLMLAFEPVQGAEDKRRSASGENLIIQLGEVLMDISILHYFKVHVPEYSDLARCKRELLGKVYGELRKIARKSKPQPIPSSEDMIKKGDIFIRDSEGMIGICLGVQTVHVEGIDNWIHVVYIKNNKDLWPVSYHYKHLLDGQTKFVRPANIAKYSKALSLLIDMSKSVLERYHEAKEQNDAYKAQSTPNQESSVIPEYPMAGLSKLQSLDEFLTLHNLTGDRGVTKGLFEIAGSGVGELKEELQSRFGLVFLNERDTDPEVKVYKFIIHDATLRDELESYKQRQEKLDFQEERRNSASGITTGEIEKTIDEINSAVGSIIFNNQTKRGIVEKVLSMKLEKGKSVLVVGPGNRDYLSILFAKLGLKVGVIEKNKGRLDDQVGLHRDFGLENEIETFSSYKKMGNKKYDYITCFAVLQEAEELYADKVLRSAMVFMTTPYERKTIMDAYMEPGMKKAILPILNHLNPDGGLLFVNCPDSKNPKEWSDSNLDAVNILYYLNEVLRDLEGETGIYFEPQPQIDMDDFSAGPSYLSEKRISAVYRVVKVNNNDGIGVRVSVPVRRSASGDSELKREGGSGAIAPVSETMQKAREYLQAVSEFRHEADIIVGPMEYYLEDLSKGYDLSTGIGSATKIYSIFGSYNNVNVLLTKILTGKTKIETEDLAQIILYQCDLLAEQLLEWNKTTADNAVELALNLKKYQRTKDIDEIISTITSQTAHLKRMTEALCDVIKSGSHEIAKQKVDINELIRQEASLVSGIPVNLKLAENLPPVYGNEDLLRNAVLNLLKNAREAMNGIENPSLTVSTRTAPDGNSVEIRVKDNDIGIPADKIGQIFEPYGATKGETGSTGLGLAITRQTVIDNGGTIDVESEPDKGTTFTLRLPTVSEPGSSLSGEAQNVLKAIANLYDIQYGRHRLPSFVKAYRKGMEDSIVPHTNANIEEICGRALEELIAAGLLECGSRGGKYYSLSGKGLVEISRYPEYRKCQYMRLEKLFSSGDGQNADKSYGVVRSILVPEYYDPDYKDLPLNDPVSVGIFLADQGFFSWLYLVTESQKNAANEAAKGLLKGEEVDKNIGILNTHLSILRSAQVNSQLETDFRDAGVIAIRGAFLLAGYKPDEQLLALHEILDPKFDPQPSFLTWKEFFARQALFIYAMHLWNCSSVSDGLTEIMKLVPSEHLDGWIDLKVFEQALKNAGYEQNIVSSDDKSALIFSEKATFGEFKDGAYEEGLGVLLPSLIKSNVRVAVVVSTDKQRALIDELNKGKTGDQLIVYADSVSDVKEIIHDARYYYLKTASEPAADMGGVTDITIVVKDIIEAIGRVADITKPELIEQMHEAARQFAVAA